MYREIKYNPSVRHRQSIRLQGYDYSRNGLYYITICTHNRQLLFGEIINRQMILNDAGKITDECWMKIPEHFPNVVLHEHVIMPDHVHGIIELTDGDVGRNGPGDDIVGVQNFEPVQQNFEPVQQNFEPVQQNFEPVQQNFEPVQQNFEPLQQNFEPVLPPQNKYQKIIPRSIGSIIRGYKIGVTKFFRDNTDIHSVWHRNFYEHIIRNERSYFEISDYIVNNPAQWDAGGHNAVDDIIAGYRGF